MDFELKFKSVAWKWITNIFVVVFIAVLIIEILYCVFINSYFLNRTQALAEEYGQRFVNPLANCSPEEYLSTAREYCEGFEHKDKIEVQVLDTSGNVLFSTTGFTRTTDDMPDYNAAVLNGKSAFWIGKSQYGERILCQTEILNGVGETSNGAVRWVVSLTEIHKNIFFYSIMGIAFGVFILLILGVSGVYFIKSIVRPIRDVSNISRKIAMGDFNSRIEMKSNNEIGELCDSINYMASELQSADNLKNEFISSVSHELRTPLTAIRGWAETAKMSIGFDEATVKKGIDVILSESERLNGLVEDLLDFSRIQSGRLSIEMSVIELKKLIEESAEMYIELAKKQKVEIVTVLEEAEIYCQGDINRIKQVFINVIDNALKYNQPGGQILIKSHTEDGCVQVTVSDTGVGIAAQDLDRVKEKFYKANKTVRGSGIGLAVADEIIKQHNGLLLIDSTEGIGTTVTIVLPVLEDAPEGENNVE